MTTVAALERHKRRGRTGWSKNCRWFVLHHTPSRKNFSGLEERIRDALFFRKEKNIIMHPETDRMKTIMISAKGWTTKSSLPVKFITKRLLPRNIFKTVLFYRGMINWSIRHRLTGSHRSIILYDRWNIASKKQEISSTNTNRWTLHSCRFVDSIHGLCSSTIKTLER